MGVANTAGRGSNRIYLLDKIAPFVDWYTNEFVARDRRCYPCRHAVLTVELDVEDLIGALRYAQIDGPCLTQSIIDWSLHIKQTAKTFREEFDPSGRKKSVDSVRENRRHSERDKSGEDHDLDRG